MLTAVSIMYVQRYMQIEYTKALNDVLNQNTTTSKRARFAIFAISVVDNLLLSQFRTCPPASCLTRSFVIFFWKSRKCPTVGQADHTKTLLWGFKVTPPSFLGGVPSYFEALWYPHLYFYRKSNT